MTITIVTCLIDYDLKSDYHLNRKDIKNYDNALPPQCPSNERPTKVTNANQVK